MGIKEAFKSLLRMGKTGHAPAEDPISIVLLLSESHSRSLEQLREAAGRAFGISFSGDRAARHSVYVRGIIFTLANVGPHKLSFLRMTKPYGAGSAEFQAFEKALPLDSQRRAWSEHQAYMAIDYVEGNVDLDSKYVVLAKLCAELCDSNCLGIYLPRENTLVPGLEAARAQLNKIMSYKNVKIS